jgi:hypothetical protein
MRSKIRWFTEFCNSHYVSHFAAFFIVARAKISVVESCSWLVLPINSSNSFRVWFTHWLDNGVCKNSKHTLSLGKQASVVLNVGTQIKECVLWFAYSMILPQVHLGYSH